ncbi:MAG TPA: glycosyl hydrolase, partial [Gammaproteobacteria bacterium]|nr:glycosyl hydrolase [Gammaproteobacteria bacterium]
MVMLVTIIIASYSSGDAWASDSEKSFHRFWPDNLFAVDFVDDNNGFIAGYSGTVLCTSDAGKHWQAYYIGKNELIRRISFVDVNTGWAVGHRGSIFHTVDGGKSWV